MSTLHLRLRGHTLPGRRFCDSGAANGVAHEAVHVGVQRGRDVVDLVPGDAETAAFEFTVEAVESADGSRDFRGPYVHGPRNDRFLYLSWGDVDGAGNFAMFRRAKLRFSSIADDLLRQALGEAGTIEGELPLTDARGGPICASVKLPVLRWRLT